MRARSFPFLILAATLVTSTVQAQGQQPFTDEQIVNHVYKPERLAPTDERIGSLKLPAGFKVETFAEGLKNPRIIAVAEDGTVYVTRRDIGDVVMLGDLNGDGFMEAHTTVAARPQMHGIAIHGRRMYLATVRDVYVADIRDNGTLGELRRIIGDLPDGGQHPNRTLAIGPDGMLYVTVGSTCNACDETNPESATVLRASPDGKQRRIFASGLRNTIGFGWHPETGQLWGMDHGIDWLGDDAQPEELNLIEEGKRYGWPYIYADGKENPQDEPPGNMTMEPWRRSSASPVLMYTAHAAPMQLVFYTGRQFPEAYRGDAFVTMRGSWNRKPPSGYEVVRVRFENGWPVAFEPFLTGFVSETENGRHGHFGRPVGLAVAKDGSLLVGDDVNGIIYRISHTGDGATDRRTEAAPGSSPGFQPSSSVGDGERTGPVSAAEAAPEPPTPKPEAAAAQAVRETGAAKLTIDLLTTKETKPLRVSSAAFENNGVMPRRFSADDERFSPPIDWAYGPPGTRAYAVLMEDPDAKEAKPYVHWIVYNIPANLTALREGLPNIPRLTEPEGVLQGQNSFGSFGWQGMKPPAGDSAHRYHVQVFALGQELRLDPGASRDEVIEAMRGQVLAAGRIIGRFAHKK